jgi:hypothetical protein
MGAVYRARRGHEDVALKQLLDVEQAERFEIEARLLSGLDHPRIARVLDYVSDENGKYLVMSLVEGTDLRDLLAREGDPGLPVADAIEWARQTCEILAYVHEQGVVHRDVKPENLILGDEGIVLVDFGIARDLPEDGWATEAVGTLGFMAPEVFAMGAVSPRSDVFGIAATLWMLIAGKPPMYGEADDLAGSVPAAGPALSVALRTRAHRPLLESVVRTAAGVFDAAAASLALVDGHELVYQAAWGAGAREVPGIRLQRGEGLAGSVLASGQGAAVASCRSDPRFAERVAAGTGYVPHTMIVVPVRRGAEVVGVLSLLDQRDGQGFHTDDLVRAQHLADMALTAVDAAG